MVRSLERRVARLETTTDAGDRCPECGNGPDDDKRPYEIVFVGPGAARRAVRNVRPAPVVHHTYGVGRR